LSFLPRLLLKSQEPPANLLRRMTLAPLGALFIGGSLLGFNGALIAVLIPGLLIVSVAFLLHMSRQAQLRPLSAYGGAALIALMVVCPMADDLFLKAPAQEPQE